jgi:hypothetical protein
MKMPVDGQATKRIATKRESSKNAEGEIKVKSPRTAEAKQGEGRKGRLSQSKEFTQRTFVQTLRQKIDAN